MNKLSLKASVAIVLLAGATAALAQGGAAPGNAEGINNAVNDPSGAGNASQLASPSAGTNSAGTAQSSGSGANSKSSVTTGSGRGAPDTTGPNDTDAAISAEDKALDHKMKSICKGC
jgi:hypothetical protein